MRRLMLAGIGFFCVGCGSSAPSAPSTPPPSPSPSTSTSSTITLSGRVTATNGGQPLGGVRVVIGAATSITDFVGAFSAQTSPASSMLLQLTGASIVPRGLTVAASTSRDLAVSAIALDATFDLSFYRQFVRNALDAPGRMEPLRRWTRTPSIRVRTVDDAGRSVDTALVAMAVRIAGDAVPAWTGFQPAAIEQGPEARTGDGWVTIGWADHADPSRCGIAPVGGDSVTLFYLNGNCSCGGALALKPQTVRHELGHAFGFWHTDNVKDAMYGKANSVCDAPLSARERYHAAIAYARPVGNVDPDTDPAGTVNLAPMRVR